MWRDDSYHSDGGAAKIFQMASNVKGIWGSNDDKNWTKITGDSKAVRVNEKVEFTNIDNPNYYKYHGIVYDNFSRVEDVKLFGIRNQGSSTLHDGQLTLTKSLNVPRIGPALDADDTPRRDRLVVEYNTSTNPTFEGAVRDTSGRGNDGVFYGDALYDATEKAFTFSGTDPSIHRVRGLGSSLKGNQQLSASFWTRINEDVDQGFFSVGDTSVIGKCFGFRLDVGSSNYNLEVSYSGSAHSSLYRYKVTDLDTPNDGKWRHFVVINAAGTKTANGTTYDYGATTAIRLFLDGVELFTMSSSTYINGVVGSASDVLNLDPNPTLSIGSFFDGAYDMRGSISNFKLYDTALTAEEVKTLYDMGRCDEGHHVVNFSKTRVGIGLGDGEAPLAMLDSRDTRLAFKYGGTTLDNFEEYVHGGGGVTPWSGQHSSGSGYFTVPGVIKYQRIGTFCRAHFDYVQYHANGSFYMKADNIPERFKPITGGDIMTWYTRVYTNGPISSLTYYDPGNTRWVITASVNGSNFNGGNGTNHSIISTSITYSVA
jgi:hypothetical protein